MTDERRSTPRVPLDSPVFATLRINGTAELLCLFKDVSLGGAMVALPPGDEIPLKEGDAVVITEPPDELSSSMLNLEAKVMWVKSEVFGINFAAPLAISQDELEEALSNACF